MVDAELTPTDTKRMMEFKVLPHSPDLVTGISNDGHSSAIPQLSEEQRESYQTSLNTIDDWLNDAEHPLGEHARQGFIERRNYLREQLGLEPDITFSAQPQGQENVVDPTASLIELIQDSTALPSIRKGAAARLVDILAAQPGATRSGAQDQVHWLITGRDLRK